MSNEIIYAVAALGGMGIVFGVLLAVASKYLSVETDERIPQITEVLPGANCGGCGFAGCGAFASAVVEKKAPINGCPVGGNAAAKNIAKIMGVKSTTQIKKVARVQCMGRPEVAEAKYKYEGISDCLAATKLSGGPKSCEYGCMGLGTCVAACQFNAISIIRGVAVVDAAKCTACGKCAKACPKNIIELVPAENTVWVLCSSHDKGAVVKDKCSVGCIGCKICEKTCKEKAIKVENCKATIDYTKCTKCGECVLKCPKKIILTDIVLKDTVQEEINKYMSEMTKGAY